MEAQAPGGTPEVDEPVENRVAGEAQALEFRGVFAFQPGREAVAIERHFMPRLQRTDTPRLDRHRGPLHQPRTRGIREIFPNAGAVANRMPSIGQHQEQETHTDDERRRAGADSRRATLRDALALDCAAPRDNRKTGQGAVQEGKSQGGRKARDPLGTLRPSGHNVFRRLISAISAAYTHHGGVLTSAETLKNSGPCWRIARWSGRRLPRLAM